MAQALVDALPQGGDIFMIQGPLSDNNVHMLKEGFDDTLEDTNLNVVYEANCDGWTAELAVGYMEEALEKYPHVKGIMCGNDDIASQVVQVLAENQLAGNVMVVGQDGDLAACQRIVEGTQYMLLNPSKIWQRKLRSMLWRSEAGKKLLSWKELPRKSMTEPTIFRPECWNLRP